MLRSFIFIFLIATFTYSAVLIPKNNTGVAGNPFDIYSHDVSVVIKNGIAYTIITQEFDNPSDQELEGEYVFPTPQGAKITEFAMWIGGKKMVGTVVERVKAQQIYQSIVDSRRDPGILEEEKRNLFKVRVFPILPKSRQKFRIAYTQELPFEANQCYYRYPLAEEADFPAGLTREFSFQAKIESGLHLANVDVTGVDKENVKVQQHQDNHQCQVNAVKKDTHFSQDLTITLTTESQASFYHQVSRNFLMLGIAPEIIQSDESTPQGKVFFVDTSASMAKNDYLQQVQTGLRECITAMNPQERFNIIAFHHDSYQVFEDVQKATPENKQKAIDFLDKLFPLGASDLGKMFQNIASCMNNNHHAILISDGLASLGNIKNTDLQRMIETKENAKLFVLAIGSKANQDLLKTLTEQQQSIFFSSEESLGLEKIVAILHQKTSLPTLEDIQVECKGPGKLTWYPEIPQQVYAGSLVRAFAQADQDGTYQLKITGKMGAQQVSWQESIELKAQQDNRDVFVEQYWEYKRIDQLLKQVRENGESKELVDEIIRLAIKNQVVTPYTAYLVLESEKDYEKYDIDRSQQNAFVTEKVGEREPQQQDGYAAPEPAEWILFILIFLATILVWRWFSPQIAK